MRPEPLDRLAHLLASRPRRELRPSRRTAAVLVPLVSTPAGLEVLFTLRTDTVPTHKGQVAFPGGGTDEGDTDLIMTALRETEEELGIPPGAVDVLGLSDDTFSISGQRVTPVVGYLPALPELRPSPHEIADVFTVPLATLQHPGGFYEEELQDHLSNPRRVPFFEGGRHTIWGLTAWILKELLTVLDGVDRGGDYLRGRD
ncbi:MAG: CoA pyrophosphatase [Deltaproteobacteria bacterium]|nr:CoA pyrophosphatase [Deltaproteobacteria bacterium]